MTHQLLNNLPDDRPFTSARAVLLGVSPPALSRLVTTGWVRPLTQNVYVAARVPDSTELRCQALALVAPRGTVVCDWTACWYWTGMDLPGRHEQIEIDAFRFRGHERLRNGLARSGQRWFVESDVVEVADGLFVTTPIRTAWDLGRFYRPVVAMGGMDALLATAMFTLTELVEGVERFKRQRGVVLLRWTAPRVDPNSESHAEAGLRVRWHEAPGLPWPQTQIRVFGPDGQVLFRIDVGDEESLFAAEYDGEEFHGPEQEEHDEGRRDVLSQRFGWHVEVFRRAGVFGQHHDASIRLARGYREALKSVPERRARFEVGAVERLGQLGGVPVERLRQLGD